MRSCRPLSVGKGLIPTLRLNRSEVMLHFRGRGPVCIAVRRNDLLWAPHPLVDRYSSPDVSAHFCAAARAGEVKASDSLLRKFGGRIISAGDQIDDRDLTRRQAWDRDGFREVNRSDFARCEGGLILTHPCKIIDLEPCETAIRITFEDTHIGSNRPGWLATRRSFDIDCDRYHLIGPELSRCHTDGLHCDARYALAKSCSREQKQGTKSVSKTPQGYLFMHFKLPSRTICGPHT